MMEKKRFRKLLAALVLLSASQQRLLKAALLGECLMDVLTLEASAQCCGITVSTAFRWRHRFLGTRDAKAIKLTGIMEVDETCFLENRKGQRDLERPVGLRGGAASKRGLPAEQVPLLVAADRSCTTTGTTLSSVTVENVREALAPVIEDDIVLVTGGNSVYPPCARSLGMRHEWLNLSAGRRVQGSFHIQTVSNWHSRFADFLDRYWGITTKYLDSYLRWFERTKFVGATPVSCLGAAMTSVPTEFAN